MEYVEVKNGGEWRVRKENSKKMFESCLGKISGTAYVCVCIGTSPDSTRMRCF